MPVNVSQNTINNNIENAKNSMTQSDIEACEEGLRNADLNGDWYTSGVEMYKNWSDTCALEFAGNEEFLKRGEEIAIEQGELYSRYAGNDGSLDVYEYYAALQSDEMGALIDEYWEMKDSMDAMNGKSEIKGLTRHNGNYDGQVSVSEYIEDKLNLFDKIFKDQAPKLQQEALNKVLEQAEIISEYAGDDGIISQEEYIQALRSETFGTSMEEYTAIKQHLKSAMG